MVEQTQTNSTNDNIGNQPEAVNIIDRADSINKRMEENIKKQEEIATRIEGAVARMMFGGKSNAGTPIKTPEEIKNERIEAEAAILSSRFKNR